MQNTTSGAPRNTAATTGRLNQTLAPRRAQVIGVLITVIGVMVAVGAALYGYLESRRTESIVIAVRDIPYGRQIVADDLGVVSLPYYRPKELSGVTDSSLVIGRYATRTIGTNDIINPSMLSPDPPDVPVYPNGRRLEKNMVPVPFSLTGVGPITDRDRVNIGFIANDPLLCDRARADVALGAVIPLPATTLAPTEGLRSYACRWMSGVPVLYIEGEVAYLEMTPAQAHALRALQAAQVALWAERYGASSEPLQYLDRLDAAQIVLPELTRPVSETVRIEPQIVGGNSAIPAIGAPPGVQPMDAPQSDRPADESATPTATPATQP
ncbi:SAF domain-containing protein [Roseiflexus castenholzii]|uniref:SAF domain-containing protein n=1 Tax=Roseiflexus castenholzii TaxID=120962 RepID=UPI003C7CF9F6